MSSLWGPGCATFDVNLPGVTDGNLKSAEFFAAAILGIMALFVVVRLFRLALPTAPDGSIVPRLFSIPWRLVRRLTIRPMTGFTSTGHAAVVVVYVVINVILLFTMLSWPLPLLSDFGRRLGWVAIANIALLFFLALKNTPIAFLTEYSYERLNELHQIAGYTTILLAVLHTSIFIAARAHERELCNIVDLPQRPGIIALGAMLIILVTSLFVKGWKYEAWYILHVILACLTLVGVGLHRPDFGTYSVQAIIFTAAIFIADLLIRRTRLILNKRNQTATLHPLASGGTMVTLSRPIRYAVPGKHVRLMINQIKFLQTHPFTIVSTDPVKFVVDAKSGFTRQLHNVALGHPGDCLPATIDGPYGTLPNVKSFQRIVLIAGGSGASYTFSLALELSKRGKASRPQLIDFIWSVRDLEKLEWYRDELAILSQSPVVNTSIYCTSHTNGAASEKSAPSNGTPMTHFASDTLSTPDARSSIITPGDTISGRPPTATIIHDAMAGASPHDRILVAACGPLSLLKSVRAVVADSISINGPVLELHIESYTW